MAHSSSSLSCGHTSTFMQMAPVGKVSSVLFLLKSIVTSCLDGNSGTYFPVVICMRSEFVSQAGFRNKDFLVALKILGCPKEIYNQ